MSDLGNIVLLALLGSVVALAGGVVFLSVKKWSNVLAKYSVPFAAGVLVTVSFLGLIPEALEIVGEKSLTIVLLTFFGAYLFEQLFCELHHHDDGHKCKETKGGQVVPLVVIGDTIHNLIDGVAIAASYLVNPGLGLITAVSTLLHEVPHEIGDFGILLKAGWSRKRILLVNLISALMTVVGAVGVYYLGAGEMVFGYLLAVAGGMFLYLGASDFLPHANEELDKKKGLMVMFFGVLVMYLTLSLVPHGH
jgi:zinc and cadmium transporter